MENVIALDSSVLIDHFRAKSREKTFFEQIGRDFRIHCVPAVAKYEVLAGVRDSLLPEWVEVFAKVLFLPLTEPIVMEGRRVAFQLRRNRKQLDMPDILIAATAIVHGLPLATLNRKHFERIDGLKLVLNKE